ncbi:MAG: hypothetical protein LJE84_01735 [Gammaproteobacteria bacterium]|nr:hypothetical protein [Gammaproteobacteria bacterium]
MIQGWQDVVAARGWAALCEQLEQPELRSRLGSEPELLSRRALEFVPLETAFLDHLERFDPAFLALPPLFRCLPGPRDPRWQRLAEQHERYLDFSRDDHQFIGRLAWLLFAGMADPGPALALQRLLLEMHPDDKRFPEDLGLRLVAAGWYEEGGAGLLDSVQLQGEKRIAEAGPAEYQSLLNGLGFRREAGRNWTTEIFESVVLPWMQAALAVENYDVALELEERTLMEYVSQTATREHFSATTSRWMPAMVAAGQRLGARLGENRNPPGAGELRVAFVLMSSSVLAHTQVLLALLSGWRELGARACGYSPTVFLLGYGGEELPDRLSELEIPWTQFDSPQKDTGLLERVLRMRDAIREQEIDVCAFVSTEVLMAFCFGMRIAPLQVWFSWRNHGLQLDPIDAYITGGSLGERMRMIDGQAWRTIPGALLELSDESLQAQAQAIRAELAVPGPVLGAISRPEKIHTPEYLDALEQILRANPGAVFLWFGRARPQGLEEELQRRGIADRCRFCGWVDTLLYARVLDVHLDAFPFPGGLTHIQCMAAGTPGVVFLSEESRQNGVLQVIRPLIERDPAVAPEDQASFDRISGGPGAPDFPVADNAGAYVAQAQRLIDDPEFRTAVSASGRRILDFIIDERRTAQAFGEQLRDICASMPRAAE